MQLTLSWVESRGIKIAITSDGQEAARAFLYILRNDLHKRPFGFLEDLFVEEDLRSQGIGSKLLNRVISEARRYGCYKLVATSRHERPAVHEFYQRLGFKDHGIEFRLDL